MRLSYYTGYTTSKKRGYSVREAIINNNKKQ